MRRGLTWLAGLAVSALAAATATPVKHVIVIIGENHSFDNIFATCRPPAGQHIRNLMTLFDFRHPHYAAIRLPRYARPSLAVPSRLPGLTSAQRRPAGRPR